MNGALSPENFLWCSSFQTGSGIHAGISTQWHTTITSLVSYWSLQWIFGSAGNTTNCALVNDNEQLLAWLLPQALTTKIAISYLCLFWILALVHLGGLLGMIIYYLFECFFS